MDDVVTMDSAIAYFGGMRLGIVIGAIIGFTAGIAICLILIRAGIL